MAFGFGSSLSQPSQTSTIFGAPAQSQQTQGLFTTPGQSSNQHNSAGSFLSGTGSITSQQPQQQSTSAFGSFGQGMPQRQPLGYFSSLEQSVLQGQGVQQHPQQQERSLQLGQNRQHSLAQSQAPPSIWEEGRGLGVYRTIPAQMMLIKEKWDPNNLACPLRTYLYQVVEEQNAPFYQPGLGEDENKWEEAVSKRPGPSYVPALARGFWDLGKRAQRQREFIEKINIRLHDINQSLDAQIEIHSQQIASRLTECRRKHAVASQRTLALAAKVQILRNRGYVMDNAEEELRTKFSKLEGEIFDPSLTSREQEIWARMLSIRERAKRLHNETERTAPPFDKEKPALDEGTAQAAKKALEAYDVQLRHLQKELQLVQEEYDEWGKGLAP